MLVMEGEGDTQTKREFRFCHEWDTFFEFELPEFSLNSQEGSRKAVQADRPNSHHDRNRTNLLDRAAHTLASATVNLSPGRNTIETRAHNSDASEGSKEVTRSDAPDDGVGSLRLLLQNSDESLFEESATKSLVKNNTHSYHPDGSTAAWVWPDGETTNAGIPPAGRDDECGPFLAIRTVASRSDRRTVGDWTEGTSMRFLYNKSSASTAVGEGFLPLHPSLAPIISLSKSASGCIVSVFDITASCRSLHETLRSNFFDRALFPGSDGCEMTEPLISNSDWDPLHRAGVGDLANRLIEKKRPWPRILAGSSDRADTAELRIGLLVYQLFNAVHFCHSRNVTLGDQLRPERIFVGASSGGRAPWLDGWLSIAIPIGFGVSNETISVRRQGDGSKISAQSTNWREIFYHGRFTSKTTKYEIMPYPGYGQPPTELWRKGIISNLTYLMILNAVCGRTPNDINYGIPVLPWVTDFKHRIDPSIDAQESVSTSYRDLSKTRFRLKKSDEMLDQTYANANPPHHIPENLSNLTFTIYKARRIPICELKRTVRPDYNANHYPSSIEKLYEWTPGRLFPFPLSVAPLRSSTTIY